VRADLLYIEHYHYRLYDLTKSVLSILSFLNFVIRLSNDSGIKEKFLSLTTGEKGIRVLDILPTYLSICTFNSYMLSIHT